MEDSPNLTSFKPGDIVVLKSGSPEMTVKSVDFNNVNCVYWHKGLNEFKAHQFDMDLLDKVVKSED